MCLREGTISCTIGTVVCKIDGNISWRMTMKVFRILGRDMEEQ